ncbi:DUF72 domain-containing protein, partial [Burkholderia cenocepacia]|nr:DUF72 domain-containing protein [Burkholderia cenocepacia]
MPQGRTQRENAAVVAALHVRTRAAALGGALRWTCMGDGRTRRKAPPQRQQHDDANESHADGQFDLFGVPTDAARASPAHDDSADESVTPDAPDHAR